VSEYTNDMDSLEMAGMKGRNDGSGVRNDVGKAAKRGIGSGKMTEKESAKHFICLRFVTSEKTTLREFQTRTELQRRQSL
jgi:hypothetical protein